MSCNMHAKRHQTSRENTAILFMFFDSGMFVFIFEIDAEIDVDVGTEKKILQQHHLGHLLDSKR